MTLQQIASLKPCAAIGFVNRRSGVQSPHPAPIFTAAYAQFAPDMGRETREKQHNSHARKSARSVRAPFPLAARARLIVETSE